MLNSKGFACLFWAVPFDVPVLVPVNLNNCGRNQRVFETWRVFEFEAKQALDVGIVLIVTSDTL